MHNLQHSSLKIFINSSQSLDHCTDISFSEFKELCEIVWSKKYDFLTIDLTSSPLNGKYRKNLDSFYIPKIHHHQQLLLLIARRKVKF